MKQDTPAKLSFIEPMNALQVRELPVGNWIYELKYDGIGHWHSKLIKRCGLFPATERFSTTITLN